MRRTLPYVWTVILLLLLIIVWVSQPRNVSIVSTGVALVAYFAALLGEAGESRRVRADDEHWLTRYEEDLDRYDELALAVANSPARSKAHAEAVLDLLEHRAKSRPDIHLSDCSTHNEPAYPNGPCDCGGAA